MPELADYSAKFDPEFSHDKFNKETLVKLLKAYSDYIGHIDGFWYLTVMRKWGNDEASDCNDRVWEKGQPYERKAIGSLLNIHGDDVFTVMKALQTCPWVVTRDYKIDVKDSDQAILTTRICPTLFSMEKEGKGRERQHCDGEVACSKCFHGTAHYYNPNIKVTPLKLPPRKNNDDICCQWEFKLEK